MTIQVLSSTKGLTRDAHPTPLVSLSYNWAPGKSVGWPVLVSVSFLRSLETRPKLYVPFVLLTI